MKLLLFSLVFLCHLNDIFSQENYWNDNFKEVTSIDLKNKKITIQKKIEPNIIRENGDKTKFHKTTLSIKIEEAGKSYVDVLTNDIYTISSKTDFMSPCVLINGNQLMLFSNSKSNENTYLMDGYIFNYDLNTRTITKEKVFEFRNWGWYCYFDESILKFFSYEGYFNMEAVSLNNIWNVKQLNYEKPETFESKMKNRNKISFLNNSQSIVNNSATVQSNQFRTDGFYIFSIPQSKFNSMENSHIYFVCKGGKHKYIEDFFVIKFNAENNFSLYSINTQEGVRGVTVAVESQRNLIKQATIEKYKNAILKDFGYNTISSKDIVITKSNSDKIIEMKSDTYVCNDDVVKIKAVRYHAYSVHKFNISNALKVDYSGRTFQRDWKWQGTTVVWDNNSEKMVRSVGLSGIDLEFISVPELGNEAILANEKKKQNEKEEQNRLVKLKKELEEKALAEYNKERIKNLKVAQVGDRICFSQDWIHRTEYKIFLGVGNETSQSYKMRVICYIERKEGDRYQIRVANIESSNKTNWSYPKLNGVELKEQSLHWIKPSDYLNNIEWNICE